jgi:Mn2+/Fe2+ NRAMP family transporter
LPEIKNPPRGLMIFSIIGPSIVWCAEYIGSGEVILATRTGAIFGTSILWAILIGVFLKFWIGLCGARYTVATGEGMIDMFARMPGPRNYAVWIVLIAQGIAGTIAIGSIASASGVFLNNLLPAISPYWAGWMVSLFAILVVWSGKFNSLKIVMSILVSVVIVGVLYVAVQVYPGLSDIISGMIPKVPKVPVWAQQPNTDANPWREILPLIGWGAGGFASQVWYTYWVIGAGYGCAADKKFGRSADPAKLQKLSIENASIIKRWFPVVYLDASIAMVIGMVVTSGFLIAGAGILGAQKLLPEGSDVALTLSNIFASDWGKTGGFIFMLGGTAALISTLIGQLAGWPRLLADSFRICLPKATNKFVWKTQFHFFLIYFMLTNMIIVFTLGIKPVFLVKLGAILDGLLLTPLQALWVGIGLFFVLPKMFQSDVANIIKPHWILGLGLAIAFLVFSYFFIFQIPFIF